MANDPLEHLKRIQAHLEALRRARQGPNINLSNPNINPAQVKFRAPGGPFFGGPNLPDPLVEWLLGDLPPRMFHDAVNETASHLKIKGYRPGHMPREEGLKILKKRYDKDPMFRIRAGQIWLQGRKKEDDAFRLLGADSARRDPWAVVQRFGFPLAVWLFYFSNGGIFRATALGLLKEVTAKDGRLEEILSEAAKKQPGSEKIWSLPKLSQDDEISRIQNEVEQILAERDRWQAEAQAEKSKREKSETELKVLREEQQKAGHARSAAEQIRKSLEARNQELESRLEELRGAEASLRRLEKQIKELEHDKSRLTRFKEEAEPIRQALTEENEILRRALAERNQTVELMKIFFAADPGYLHPVYQGQVLLLVLAEDPAEYFLTAKEIGLTLLVHNGSSVDGQLEKFLGQAWQVAVLGGESDFPETVKNALRHGPRPPIFLPHLPAPAFGRLLMAAAPRLLE